MKNSVVCLTVMASLFFAVNLTFGQENSADNQGDLQTTNQDTSGNVEEAQRWDTQGNSNEAYVPENTESNSDTAMMPFVPQDNSVNADPGTGN